jgi:gag-polypeptide of LTR copia-type
MADKMASKSDSEEMSIAASIKKTKKSSKRTEETTASSRILLFSGKQKDWVHWEEKFLAKAKRKYLKDLYLGKIPIPKETDHELDDDDLKIIDQNEIAYSELMMAMDTTKAAGKVAFSLVRSSKSKDYPDGHAAVAWKRLKQKYLPDAAPTMTKLQQQFYSSRLEKNQYPNVRMTKMEYIRSQLEDLSSEMTDVHFMTQIIKNLTDDYKVLVEIVGRTYHNDVNN